MAARPITLKIRDLMVIRLYISSPWKSQFIPMVFSNIVVPTMR